MVYPGQCPMSPWEDCVRCCCWVDCSAYAAVGGGGLFCVRCCCWVHCSAYAAVGGGALFCVRCCWWWWTVLRTLLLLGGLFCIRLLELLRLLLSPLFPYESSVQLFCPLLRVRRWSLQLLLCNSISSFSADRFCIWRFMVRGEHKCWWVLTLPSLRNFC